VGLMELLYDGRELVMVKDFILFIDSESECTPLDIVYFEERLTVLCLGSFQVLMSCSINVDEANILLSTLSDCVTLYRFAGTVEYRNISNFVEFDDQLLFSANGIVYGITIDRYRVQIYSSLGDVDCNHLENARDHIIYAYCASGGTIVYNIDTQRVEGVLAPNLSIPIPCPQSEEMLFAVQQTNQGTVVRYNDRQYRTTGLNFTHGVCYNTDTLFLVDSVEGTKVFQVRQGQGSFHTISESSNVRDRDLVVFDGPYLMIQSVVTAEIILYDPTFQAIIRLHGMAVATGIVLNQRQQPHPTTMPTAMSEDITTSDNPPMKDEPSLSTGELIGIAFVIVIVLAMVVSIVLIVAAVRKCRKR
jgi:hypothetical protein